MAEQAANLNLFGALSRANAASSGLITPETSRFLREILKKALTNPVGVAPGWEAQAWALLANVLVNDYLHSWNYAGKAELSEAGEAAANALAIDPDLALGHHASGLVLRARGDHQRAYDAFTLAVASDQHFARALAQQSNELTLLGRLPEALEGVEKAINLSPYDPTVGISHWVKGRAHFFGKQYREAIEALEKSVKFHPTVWYNRLYLVSAYAHEGDMAMAVETLTKFSGQSQFARLTLDDIAEYERANPNTNELVVNGRAAFREGLRRAWDERARTKAN